MSNNNNIGIDGLQRKKEDDEIISKNILGIGKFKGKLFTQVTSSGEFKKQELYRKLPSVLRLGKKEKKQGGFFNYDKILSADEVTKNYNNGKSSHQ